MSARKPRWEIVQTSDGFHARHRSSNGRTIVSSEVYERQRTAFRAVELVTQAKVYDVQGSYFITLSRGTLEVRLIDERHHPDPIVDGPL